MFDLIGDIHGHAKPLVALLKKLGYEHNGSHWYHPDRQVIFLGDFIDRGPDQLEVITIAKSMVEKDAALAVMGNHEFNAVAYATPYPEKNNIHRGPEQLEVISIAKGMVKNDAALAVMGNHEFNAVAYATPHPKKNKKYLRKHSVKNTKQHAVFLRAVGEGSSLHTEIINWFKTLPIFIEHEAFRVIHACWHPPSLELVKEHLNENNQIKNESWLELTTKGTQAFEALETLLKGYEIPLPEGHGFPDKDKNWRTDIRTKWWSRNNVNYSDVAIVHFAAKSHIPEQTLDASALPGYDADKPLFLGHYWLTGTPQPTTDHIAILDYSVASEHGDESEHAGKLCAYRWDGEQNLSADKFEWVHG